MTRKDTIIIAVFVNAVLLIALFITAIKREPVVTPVAPQQQLAAQVTLPVIPDPVEKKEVKATTVDEMDQVLKEFSEKKIVAEEKTPPKIDFAKELEAITKAASLPQKPASAPLTKMTQVGEGIEVLVQKGDSLEKIARTYGVKVDQLIAFNHLASTTLQIGQKLKIPGQKSVMMKVSSTSSTITSGGEFYTVKQGDNPWTIAVKNHLKVDELLRLNNLNEDKARRLKPGDKLRIR